MFNPTATTDYSRKVVALHLSLGLGAVLLSLAGGMTTARSLLEEKASAVASAHAARLAASIERDQSLRGGANLQLLIEQASRGDGLEYCAVVGPDGAYAAHSDLRMVGAVADLAAMAAPPSQAGHRLTLHRSPLELEGRDGEALIVAVRAPTHADALSALAGNGAFLFLPPAAVLALGAWLLHRASASVAEIDRRLRSVARLPRHDPPKLASLPANDLSAVGWNRIAAFVDELEERVGRGPIQERLQQLAGQAQDGKTQAALQAIGEGIAVTNAEGRIDFANRAVAALLGSPDQLEGTRLDDLLRSIDEEHAEALLGPECAAEAVAEMRLACPSGDRTVRLSRAPLPAGPDAGHVWTARDVTQQKLAEASRDQFIDTATHELRTPLANIKAYAETLAMGDLTDVEQQKEFCNTINTEATRLARFVDDLLSISSLEVGSLGIQRQNVDVRRLLEEAAEKVKPLMKQGGLEFEVSLSEKLGEAHLDKDKVSGLVVNLLGNAAKYTPAGGAVSLRAQRHEDQLQIEVVDTGAGISEDEQPKVFEKFFRSENPDVQDKVGTGLGLPLAREIARLHRGELTLKSELGEGSTFTATLPIR